MVPEPVGAVELGLVANVLKPIKIDSMVNLSAHRAQLEVVSVPALPGIQ